MQWTGQQAMLDLRRDLMAHFSASTSRSMTATQSAHAHRVTTDVDALNELLARVSSPSSATSSCWPWSSESC